MAKKKIHSDYDFVDGDQIFVNNSDGTVEYAEIQYVEDLAAYLLVYFTDKYFNDLVEVSDTNGQKITKTDFLYEVGFECLERVKDYKFSELP